MRLSLRPHPWIALYALVMIAAACSRRAEAPGKEVPDLGGVFDGFQLLTPRERVLAEASRKGMKLDCWTDPDFDPFCTPGLEPPAGKPAISFGFRDGVLVSLARSLTKERRSVPVPDLAAHYHRVLGEPVVEGWMNPHQHARLWASADTSVIGSVSCADPADGATCDVGVDYTPGTRIPRILDDWRGMIERNPTPGPTPIPSHLPAQEHAP